MDKRPEKASRDLQQCDNSSTGFGRRKYSSSHGISLGVGIRDVIVVGAVVVGLSKNGAI
jgi:hypothetical protein